MEVAGHKQARSKSFLTRKSSKKQDDHLAKQQRGRRTSTEVYEKEPDIVRPFLNPFALSIIPDPLNELPTWYHREVETATVSAAQFRVKYPLYNPVGPRWYRNHHLLPPSQDGRPPSVFSPSFPPMASAPERGQDPSRMAGPSRTPSGSPLPTPTSSQIRIQEPPKPRTRKVSQGAHDHVEIVDGLDTLSPDGYNHASYDHGGEPESPISPSSASPPHYGNRPRRASMTHGARHRTMAPSPLSQSTSAVHLHAIDPAQIQLPRKLSKRRKPFKGLFNGPGGEGDTHGRALQRQSTLGPSMTSLPSLQPSMQKSKRGSVLGRLVKRFSVLRKTDKPATQNGYGTSWPHAGTLEPGSISTTPTSPQSPEPRERTSSRLSRSSEAVRRVPPPSIDAVQRESMHSESRRSIESLSVHDMPPSGRLVVANPDYPSSGDNTPTGVATPLPTSHMEETGSPSPPPKESYSLPEMPRTTSPIQMDSLTTPRPPSMRIAETVEPPLPPSSPPLPDIPPPTPVLVRYTLVDEPSVLGNYSSASTVGPSSPAARPVSYAGSSASTARPLPPNEDPNLARASMYVNPPTPYAAPTALVIPPVVFEEPQQSSSKRMERSPTKSKEGATRRKSARQTETFKLVRSPSGTIKQAEVIMGMGEHWELVETPADTAKKSKSQDKKSRSSDHDQAVGREESRRRQDHSSSTEEGDSRHKRQTSTSGREKPPSIISVRSTQTPVAPRRSVKKSTSSQDPGENRSSKTVSASISAAAAPLPEHTRERRPSATGSTRPNSELHSAAELSSMKAKDTWEMERLWKARSMAYGPDGMPIVSTPATIGSDSRPSTFIGTELQRVRSIPSVTAMSEVQKTASVPPSNPIHGSSHTYVVVQAPYQGAHGHASYAQFASPPPQNPTMSPAQQFYRHPGYISSDPSLMHNPLPSPPRHSTYQPMALANPLPDPPRLSAYQPAPLPASLAGSGDSSRASWSQYGGMTN